MRRCSASLFTYTRASNSWLQISISELMTNHTSDADGDALTLVSVGSGTNGATVLVSGDSIYYLPPNPDRNTTDYLDYAVTDGFPGGTVRNQIRIQLDAPAPTPATFTGITVGAGSVSLTFYRQPKFHVSGPTHGCAGSRQHGLAGDRLRKHRWYWPRAIHGHQPSFGSGLLPSSGRAVARRFRSEPAE